MDPQFKQLKFLDETVRLQTQTEVVRRMDQFTMSAEPSSHCASGAEPRPKKRKALDILLGAEEECHSTTTPSNELHQYLSEAPVSRNNNQVSWWKEQKHRFP